MLKQCLLLSALLLCGLDFAGAETIQLKSKAVIIGKILAEKPDQVIVDLGYTLLDIPRNQISKISQTGEAPVKSVPAPVSEDPTPVAAVTPGFYSAATRPVPASTVRDLVNKIGEAVVQVRTPGGLGSGFFINADGFLMTNFHVIEGETQITVEVYHTRNGQVEPRVYKQVRIVAINKFGDLALLKIEDKDAPRFKYVMLGKEDAVAVGESVFAIGSPLGLERTVTEGILSTKTRQVLGELYLQTTAQINPGNSGGPLFNLGGEVIGITNMKVMFGEGIAFAIPVSAVKYFLDHREAFAYSNDNPSGPYHYLEPPSRTRQGQTGEN